MKKSLGAKTIVYPAPVLIIGSYGKDGKPNLMTAAWGGICSSIPPCIAVSVRKSRKTYENIVEQKSFTISILSEIHRKEADFFGLVTGKDIDKFEVAKLTPLKSDLVNAPYAKEFPLIIECKLIKEIELGSHIQFIGEIVDVKLDEEFIDEDGIIDINKLRPISFCPADGKYYGLGKNLGKSYDIGKDIMDKQKD